MDQDEAEQRRRAYIYTLQRHLLASRERQRSYLWQAGVPGVLVLAGAMALVAVPTSMARGGAAPPTLCPAPHPAPSMATYTSTQYGYLLRYPRVWSRRSIKTAALGSGLTGLDQTSLRLSSPDEQGGVYGTAGRISYTATRMRQTATRLLETDDTPIGPIRYGRRVINGVMFASATARVSFGQGLRGDQEVLATAHHGVTYVFTSNVTLDMPGTAADRTAAQAILASITLCR